MTIPSAAAVEVAQAVKDPQGHKHCQQPASQQPQVVSPFQTAQENTSNDGSSGAALITDKQCGGAQGSPLDGGSQPSSNADECSAEGALPAMIAHEQAQQQQQQQEQQPTSSRPLAPLPDQRESGSAPQNQQDSGSAPSTSKPAAAVAATPTGDATPHTEPPAAPLSPQRRQQTPPAEFTPPPLAAWRKRMHRERDEAKKSTGHAQAGNLPSSSSNQSTTQPHLTRPGGGGMGTQAAVHRRDKLPTSASEEVAVRSGEDMPMPQVEVPSHPPHHHHHHHHSHHAHAREGRGVNDGGGSRVADNASPSNGGGRQGSGSDEKGSGSDEKGDNSGNERVTPAVGPDAMSRQKQSPSDKEMSCGVGAHHDHGALSRKRPRGDMEGKGGGNNNNNNNATSGVKEGSDDDQKEGSNGEEKEGSNDDVNDGGSNGDEKEGSNGDEKEGSYNNDNDKEQEDKAAGCVKDGGSHSQSQADHHHHGNSQHESQRMTAPTTGGGGNGGASAKRARLVWTPELHQRFMDAVKQLGINNCMPKNILQLMDVEGMSRENVASHLQKYRQTLRKVAGVALDAPLPPSILEQVQEQVLFAMTSQSSLTSAAPKVKLPPPSRMGSQQPVPLGLDTSTSSGLAAHTPFPNQISFRQQQQQVAAMHQAAIAAAAAAAAVAAPPPVNYLNMVPKMPFGMCGTFPGYMQGGGMVPDMSSAAGQSMDALSRQMSLCNAAMQQHLGMYGPLPMHLNPRPPPPSHQQMSHPQMSHQQQQQQQAALAAMHQFSKLTQATANPLSMPPLPHGGMSMASAPNPMHMGSSGVGGVPQYLGHPLLQAPSMPPPSMQSPQDVGGGSMAALSGLGMQHLAMLQQQQHYMNLGLPPAAAAMMAAAAAGGPNGVSGLTPQQQLTAMASHSGHMYGCALPGPHGTGGPMVGPPVGPFGQQVPHAFQYQQYNS